jgi:hypothetical protein
LYFAGLRTGSLLRVSNRRLMRIVALPQGTHNAQPFRGGIIYNDTTNDRLCARFEGREIAFPLSVNPKAALHWVNAEDPSLARPLFARGLCPLSARYVAAGSSPSTITIYDLEAKDVVSQVSLSNDVRNAVHGLAVWALNPPVVTCSPSDSQQPTR